MGVLDWVRGDGPEPPYALIRLQDDSEVEVLKVITVGTPVSGMN